MSLIESIEAVRRDLPLLRQGSNMAEPSPYELDKRIALLELTVKSIDKRLVSISSNLNRLVWVVIGAVVVGVINLWAKGSAPISAVGG
jgi:hypothetical protein